MPLLTLTTNAEIPDADSLVKIMSKAVAKTTGKPESYVAVQIVKAAAMSFGGTNAPCAVLRLESIGSIKGKQGQHAQALTNAVTGALKLDGQRVYVNFEDVAASNWAMNGSTFG